MQKSFMDDRDIVRLKHMLDSIEAILSFIKGKTREQLDKDRLLISGIIRELEICGEAANAVTNETKQRFPNIPWKQMIGMRNRLIHAYFDIDNDIVWKTVSKGLPSLAKKIKKALKASPRKSSLSSRKKA